MSDNKRRTLEDADDFWDLDALMPPRSMPPRRMPDVETVEISLGDGGSNRSSDQRIEASKEPKSVKQLQNDNGNGGSLNGSSSERASQAERKYPPITASPAKNGAQRIDFEEWLRRRHSVDARFDDLSDGDEVTEYSPLTPLISEVRVIRKNAYGQVADQALSDMKKMVGKSAEFTKNVEFTAYFPQYVRMTEEQKTCYFGFRHEVENGRYPRVDESYILLLLFEIINLTEQIPPERGRELFCRLMVGYKDCSDSLFTSMCDWLEDYCLIYNLPAPIELLEPIRERVFKRASWKEFYVPYRADTAEADACIMITSASSYDYRKSKYYTAETAEIFERHIPKAVGAAIRSFSEADPSFKAVSRRDTTKLLHEAFRGAYRSVYMRYTVSVECYCFTRSPLLRQTVTGMVKFSENFVRELLGIKSRLTVSCLGSEKKQLIKQYFEPFVKRVSDAPPLKRGRKRLIADPATIQPPEPPEYEKYYEPEKREFSPELARKIESDSWRTTDMLLEAFGDDADIGDDSDKVTRKVALGLEGEKQDTEKSVGDDLGNGIDSGVTDAVEVSGFELGDSDNSANGAVNRGNFAESGARLTGADSTVQGLRLLLRGRMADFRALALGVGLLPETLAQRINELALEEYGDIAVEIGEGFEIIEDYREELDAIAADRN